MSTYKDSDLCSDIILDFIAGGVDGNESGESEGNYNAVIGNAHASEDLSQKTFDEIYKKQYELKASGQPSTAIGRYQFIQSTLHNLQEKLKLPDNTKFTPELQDRLALELMVGRGYSNWWKGNLSDEEFAHNLSLEWASLPDPDNNGKSHYDGVGPNHASTTLDVVYSMLESARAAQGAAASNKPAAPQPAPAQAPSQAPKSAPKSAADTSADTSADALNRQELDRVKREQTTVVAARPRSEVQMAPAVALGYGGGTLTILAGNVQFLWPLLHGQMPDIPTGEQATNLAGGLLLLGSGLTHLWNGLQFRKGNRP